MDKQIKYLLGVLIILLISAYFASLLGGLPQYFKDDIIAALEERISGEISFSSVSLWPLNRLRLNSFSFKDQNGNELKVEELNLDYELNLSDFDQIIKVKFVEAKKAEIITAEGLLDSNLEAQADGDLEPDNKESGGFELANFDLPEIIEGININILDSKLLLKSKNYDLEFDNLNFGLKADGSDDYQLKLSTAVLIDKLNYNDYSFSDFEGEKLEISLQRSGNEAEVYFNTKSFAVAPFLELLPEENYNLQGFNLDLNTVEGLFAAKGKLDFGASELKNYEAEVNFEDLKFSSNYQQQGTEEEFDFDFNDLNLIFSGPEFKLAAVDNQFLLDDNRLQFSLKLDQELQYQLELSAEEFNYRYDFLAPELERGDLAFDLKLNGAENKINQARAEVEAADLRTEYTTINNSSFVLKLLDDEIFLEKAELELEDDSKLDLQASYDLQKENYLVKARAESVQISDQLISLLESYDLADDYLQQFRKVEGDSLDFNADAAGYYSFSRGISASGNFDLDFNFENPANNLSLESQFWYVDSRLFINSLKLFSDFAYLDLLGEVDFAERELDLRYAVKNFEPAVLNKNFDLNFDIIDTINPTIKYAEGRIGESFDQPTITTDLSLDELSYQNYVFNEINIKAVYENDNLKLTEARAAVSEALLRASGEIRGLSEDRLLDLEIKSENLYFQDFAESFNQELPLNGGVDLRAQLSGNLADYNLDLQLRTSNTVFNYSGREFDLSNLSADIKKEKGEFQIEDFSFEQQDLSFEAAGIYSPDNGFDLNYQFSGIEPQNYLNEYPNYAEKIDGVMGLQGKLQGQIDSITTNFELAAEDLNYDGFELEILENDFELKPQQQSLSINNFAFNFAAGEYRIEGEVSDLMNIPQTKLNLELIDAASRGYFEKYLGFYPFAQELNFKGDAAVESQGLDYSADLNIDAYLDQSEQSSFNLSGKIGREINLDFQASDLPLEFYSSQFGINLDTKANLGFEGSIDGSLESPILNLSHNLDSIEINNTALEAMKGDILLESQRRISSSQTINFREGGSLELDGSYSFNQDELSLSSNLQEMPVSFLLSFFGDQISGDGQLNGNFRADGTLAEPNFSGNLEMQGNSLELGIWAPIENYRGQIELNKGRALINELRGDFVDGNFQAGGQLNLLDRENFWDLELNGRKLYFDYGSLEGDFDSDLSFKGPMMKPLLAGDLEVYDFRIGIPFEWPAAEQENEGAFVPAVELDINPGEDVRVKNQNMDVLVQNGDLNIDFDHERDNSLMMEGRLRSSEGRFNYYNSRFTLNRGEVLFNPVDEGDIPEVQANATTYAGGREININVSGPADDMRINFSSNPEMTEEEILNLLSSRGALGSAVVGGEDIGIQQIILQELIRVVNSFLQEDIISDIESDFRSALSLDRIEIDASQFGLEREFAIYLGKNLSKRFYLEYASFFGEGDEREDEISFQYKLTEITNLKGTYFGDDDYQITIENEIEF
ncbi:MAG: translocation/assembly module TamB domain-containing protein [Halanaerobium sp.]